MKQKHLVRRVPLFYTFTNLFNLGVNRRQLDSHTCFCFWSIVVSHVLKPLGNSTVCSWENKGGKGKKLLSIMKMALTLRTP